MRNNQPFFIKPEKDFLTKHPTIKRLSHDLALKYADLNLLVTDDDLKIIGSLLWQALECDKDFDIALKKAENDAMTDKTKANDEIAEEKRERKQPRTNIEQKRKATTNNKGLWGDKGRKRDTT